MLLVGMIEGSAGCTPRAYFDVGKGAADRLARQFSQTIIMRKGCAGRLFAPSKSQAIPCDCLLMRRPANQEDIPSLLDSRSSLRYLGLTRERRLIQRMQIECFSSFLREVTEA